MYAQPMSFSRSIRHYRAVVLAVVCLLLWGMWTFAVHSHHDETLGTDTECQACQFGAYSSAALPAVESPPIPLLSELLSGSFTEITFMASHVRAQDARAPPFIS
ncbi:MAG: hypothetical protein P1R74_03385 [Sedimenticola sp.]|nr:hypothetical protein [Sedimenticola sp.]